MWRRVDLVWTDVSEERIASIFRVEKSADSRWFLGHGFFYYEDGGDTFLCNVGSHKIYMVPHPRRRHSSQSPLWKPQILHNFILIKVSPYNITFVYPHICLRIFWVNSHSCSKMPQLFNEVVILSILLSKFHSLRDEDHY
jgi:hypothetical protein